MRYLVFAAVLALALRAVAVAQYGYPMYMTPRAAIQWQYGQAYGYRAPAVHPNWGWQMQHAARPRAWHRHNMQVNPTYRALHQLDERLLRMEHQLRVEQDMRRGMTPDLRPRIGR